MDSAANRALAGLIIHVNHGVEAANCCTHLMVPIRPALAVCFLFLAVWLDIESLFLIVISMCLMLLDFVKAWPFNLRSKHQDAQYDSTSKSRKPVLEKKPIQDWKMHLDPEALALDAALVDSCESIFGAIKCTAPKLIAIGPALMGPAPKLEKVLNAVARITAEAIPGAKAYGFERMRTAPGYPGGSMEIVIVVPSTVLVKELGARLKRGIKGGQLMLSSSQLHKSALRYLIDHLVNAGFKFRCSAFKAQEPTVAISVPYAYSGGQGVYVSLSVNNPLPFLEASLVHEASVSDPRAVPLIATVQNWAEARGLAHPVFGPLTMYGWVHTCLFFLTQAAQPRMAPVAMEPRRHGFLQPNKDHSPVDPILLERFFDFCAKFAFGRNHMWLREKSLGPDAPFIEDVLRPGIDLGYHLQHRLPRKQLQGEAALAASALQAQSDNVSILTELKPVKTKSPGPRNSLHQQWDHSAHSELRMMKKTRASEMPPPFPSTIPTFGEPQSLHRRNAETKDDGHSWRNVRE